MLPTRRQALGAARLRAVRIGRVPPEALTGRILVIPVNYEEARVGTYTLPDR